MITIEINKKKEKIKTFNELTVSELKQWFDLQRNGIETNLIHYLSIVKGIEYKAAYNLTVKKPEVLMSGLGEVLDYENEPIKDDIIVSGIIYKKSDIEIFTVGQRFTIENNLQNYDNEEMLCFILAVAILKDESIDIELTKKITSDLMECNCFDVLPLGFFLLMNLRNGKKREPKFLKKLILKINILLKRKWLELKLF